MLRRDEFDEFDVLDELRKHGPLPRELEQHHQKMRRQQLFKAGLKADHYPPPSSSSLVDAEMSVGDWLRAKWASADETVRHSLRLLADKLGIPLPLRRTRGNPAQDSSPTRRTDADQHTTNDESAPLESPAEKEGRDYYDPPASDDDDADGWTPVESLTEALHDALDPEDRGWF